jgi:hypothetical protein
MGTTSSRHLPRLIQHVLHIHAPCCVRTTHVCMYLMLLLIYAFFLGLDGITRYTPTAVYLSVQFMCECCGSAFLCVTGKVLVIYY